MNILQDNCILYMVLTLYTVLSPTHNLKYKNHATILKVVVTNFLTFKHYEVFLYFCAKLTVHKVGTLLTLKVKK